MNKKKIGRKLSRKTDQRKALLRSLANNLILKEKITTTSAKAKETSRFVEKLINHAVLSLKDESVALAKTKILSGFLNPKAVKKLKNEIAPRYKERHGGYTRIIKKGIRLSDSAKISIIELLK